MTRAALEAAIPHRGPMLLLDEIVSQDAESIVCRKTFRPDEFFFQGHYPDDPLVPGVILCECGLQAGAVLLASMVADTPGVPVATRLKDVKFKHMVRPGDTVEVEARFGERLANAFFLTARISSAGKLAARLEFACALAEVSA